MKIIVTVILFLLLFLFKLNSKYIINYNLYNKTYSYKYRYKKGYVKVTKSTEKEFSVFYTYKRKEIIPLIIYTIVLNGWPFITYHYNIFKDCNRLLQWHIIEGFAIGRDNYKYQKIKKTIKEIKNGKSIDKTSEYIDYLLSKYPESVVLHRAPHGKFWRDKIEMISTLHSIKYSCVMMQIDVDELWTANQLNIISDIFEKSSSKRCMYFNCHYFITKKYVTISPNKPSHMNNYEWIRAWKYDYGDLFIEHGPPILLHNNTKLYGGECYLHSFTENMGLVFTHYSYVEENIVKFKESFYGSSIFNYSKWKIINEYKGKLPLEVSKYFGWMQRKTYIDIPERDIFGKNISIVKYPHNIIFNYKYYIRNVYKIFSYIKKNCKSVYVTIIKGNLNYKEILSKLINISQTHKNSTLCLFTEYVVYINYLSYIPKVWYNGSMYIELYKNNYIYGYVKIIYVDYIFIKNKKFKNFDSLVI